MLNAIKYPFTNSVVFAMVMEDPELCRELIARIFPQRKVEEVRIREKPEVVTEATGMTLSLRRLACPRMYGIFPESGILRCCLGHFPFRRVGLSQDVWDFPRIGDFGLSPGTFSDQSPTTIIPNASSMNFSALTGNWTCHWATNRIMILNSKCSEKKVPEK